MSLFEWLGECIDPGPVGTVDGPRPLFPHITRAWAIIIAIAGITLLLVCLQWINIQEDAYQWRWRASLLIYLILAWGCTPNPDGRNLGWFGGLMDNPFRITDDMNRILVFVYMLLLPGKLIVFGLFTPYHLFKRTED